jgi:hypothetical protein
MHQTFVRRLILGCFIGGAASAMLLSFAARGYAAAVHFKADLKGSSEVPPNMTAGTGSVTVAFDPATKQLTWHGTYSGLTGPATAAHIHGPAPAGSNAGVVLWISDHDTKPHPFPSPFQGSATLTDQQASDLQAGRYYVNIHTAENPGGELRGQIVTE